jgi:hypothetical protein
LFYAALQIFGFTSPRYQDGTVIDKVTGPVP